MYCQPINCRPNSACPNCWHHPLLNKDNGSIGNFSIHVLVTFKGGILNNQGTCDHCNFNFVQVRECTNCKPDQPCPYHYASGYNGTANAHMPEIMHNIYMRNSPYQHDWYHRPASIGIWYGKQQTSYMEVLHCARRFTDDYKVQYEFNHLENILRRSLNKYQDFWRGFENICQLCFSNNDNISRAMCSYFQTIRGPHQYPQVLK